MNTSNRITVLKTCFCSVLAALMLSGCSSLSFPIFSSTQGEPEAVEQPERDPQTLSGEKTERAGKAQGNLTTEPQNAQALRQRTNRYELTKHAFSVQHQTKFHEALSLYRQGKNEQAKTLLLTLIADIKKSSFADVPSAIYVLLGDIAQDNAQIKEARVHYETARKHNENNYFALNRLGIMAREEGEFTMAESLYLDALDAWPGNPTTYYNLGILYDLYMGEKNKALQYYEKYAALVNSPVTGEVNQKESKKIARWIADVKRQLPATDEGRQHD